MNSFRLVWGLIAFLGLTATVILCVIYGWLAVLIAVIVAVVPVVTFILGMVLITILGSSEVLAWNILLAGVAWLTHIAADRAVGYGLRAADGTIRVSSGVL